MLRYSLRDLAWLTFVVALALGWAMSWRQESLHGPRLALVSGYAFGGLFSSEHSRNRLLTLVVSLDGQGGGTGKLEIDPNYRSHDLFGKLVRITLLGSAPWDVTLKELKRKPAEAADSTRSYEILGHRLDGRLILIVPRYRSSACQLLSLDSNGEVRDVLLLAPRTPRDS